MPEHHLGGKDEATGVDLVLVGVLRCRAVSGLEDGMAADVVDVAAGGNADTAHAGRQGVGDVVTVEVQRGDHAVVRRPGQDLLQERVRDTVLDDQAPAGARVLEGTPGTAVELHGAELALGQLVAPVAEGPLGVLHDVALVNQRHRVAPRLDGIADGGAHQTGSPFLRHGLDAEAGGLGKAYLGKAVGEVLLQESAEGLGLRLAVLELDAGVDVLGVLTEDDHVDGLGVLDRGRHAVEVAYGPQADVEVEELPDGDVQAADTTPDRRRQRPFDADQVLLEGVEGGLGQPLASLLEGLLTGEDFAPLDAAPVAVGLADGTIDDVDGGTPDVRARAIALDVGDNGMVAHLESGGRHTNGIRHGRSPHR